VVVEGMRPGPSTGLPTWTDQADLRFVMHASQGEFPRLIFLPGDMNEAFEMTLKAFNLAEKYQMICFVLTDKYLGESVQSVEPFNVDYKADRGALMTIDEAAAMKPGEYKRFEFTESGVSRRALPGFPNTIYAVSTDEHQEYGDLDESGENRTKMVDKRAKKLVTLQNESLSDFEMFELHGPADSELTLISWGSTKGPILEALEVANEGGLKVNFLQIKTALPFASEGVVKILNAAKKTLLIETNSEAQMGGVIREKTGILIENRFLRYDGRPFHPAEILDKIKSL
ncbi:MAG: Pyruvate flavodoxin/ferredoxin oxidoreductase-like protein, partial [Candidatus Peregrinibacteria bacterium GW2011_GWA2_47_7]